MDVTLGTQENIQMLSIDCWHQIKLDASNTGFCQKCRQDNDGRAVYKQEKTGHKHLVDGLCGCYSQEERNYFLNQTSVNEWANEFGW